MKAVLLVVGVALAGCATPAAYPEAGGATDPLADRDASSRGSSLLLHDCEDVQGVFPLAPGSADRFLPSGFRADLFGDFLPIPVPTLLIFGVSCERVSQGAEDHGALRFGGWAVLVDPPDEWRRDADSNHLFLLGAAVDGPAAAALSSWGVGLEGIDSVEIGSDGTSGVRTGRVRVVHDAFSLDLGTASSAASGRFSERQRFFFVLDDENGAVFGAFDRTLGDRAPETSARGGNIEGVNGRASFVVDGDPAAFPASRGNGIAEHFWWFGAEAENMTFVQLEERS